MLGKKWTPDSSVNATINNTTTGTGRALPVNDCRQAEWFTVYTSGSAPTTGTIIIEHAPSADYAGTWNQLDSIDCSLLSAGTAGYGTYPGPIAFLRGRFSVDTDQAVTVYLNGLLG